MFGDEEGVVMPVGWKLEGLKKIEEGPAKGMAEGGVDVRERDGERKKKKRRKN